jgi:hypothetical protein
LREHTFDGLTFHFIEHFEQEHFYQNSSINNLPHVYFTEDLFYLVLISSDWVKKRRECHLSVLIFKEKFKQNFNINSNQNVPYFSFRHVLVGYSEDVLRTTRHFVFFESKDMKIIGLVLFVAAISCSDVLVLTLENFESVISSQPILLVEFYAPWYKLSLFVLGVREK